MADDFKQLEFHSLKLQEKTKELPGITRDELEGILCLECKVKCTGFLKHPWRPGCSKCRCPLWKHDIPQNTAGHPFDRLNVVETLPPLLSEYDKALTEGYSWVPRGLRTSQLQLYMRNFSKENIPKVNTEGANFRARQLMHQLPLQDYHSAAANFLTESSKNSFEDLAKKRVKKALGVGAVRAALSTSAKCKGCSDTINPGQMAVFAERVGADGCWHPQCFSCCVDDAQLADLVYFLHENNLYCGRHWAEKIKPRCYACEELIYTGEYTKAMEQTWHVDHFCCFECEEKLTGKKYIIINNHPYCQLCYNESIANTCFKCEEPISPECKDMFVKNRHYHKECLTCSQCKKPLESQTFSFVNDIPVCHKCRGVDPEKSQYCHKCNESFFSEEKKVGVGNDYFHERCFLCSSCEKPIGSQKFIRKSDGRRLCNACFEVAAKTCSKCDNLIRGSTVKFEGNAFHTECFLCTNCKKELGGVQFYKNEEKPFCEECYLSNHAKRCAACYEPIEGNTKFIDYDRKYWHSKCFSCTNCKSMLAGAKFVVRDGSRYCLECK